MEANATLQPGQIVNGKYRIDGVIGCGGMGTVYRAVQLAISRPVAIKLLHQHYLNEPTAIERFRHEANLVGKVASDNICEVIDYGMFNKRHPYFVMPLLRGCTLKQVRAGAPVALPRAIDIVQQALLALQAVHDARIVHHDLKPANIFITRVGDRHDFVKLLDFGISTVFGHHQQLSRNSSDNPEKITGTPAYMSPEQVCNPTDAGPQSDIYAMGVILYELTTGRRPHDGDSFSILARKITEAPYLPPRKANPDISAKLEQVIIRALQKDPGDRFDTATSFRDALLAIDSTRSISRSAPVNYESSDALTQTMTLTRRDSTAETIETYEQSEQTEAEQKTGRFHRRIVPAVVVLIVGSLLIVAITLGVGQNAAAPSSVPTYKSAPLHLSIPHAPPVVSISQSIPVQSVAIVDGDSHSKTHPPPAAFSADANIKTRVLKTASDRQFIPQRQQSAMHTKPESKIKGRFQTEIISEYAE